MLILLIKFIKNKYIKKNIKNIYIYLMKVAKERYKL